VTPTLAPGGTTSLFVLGREWRSALNQAPERLWRPRAAPSFVGSWGGFGGGERELNKPASIVRTAAGRLLVADQGNNRVVAVNWSGEAPVPTASYAWPFLSHATDLVVGGSGGEWWLCDRDGTGIFRIRGSGSEPVQVGRGFRHPVDIALSPDEKVLYVADAGHMRVVRMTIEGEYMGEWTTTGPLGEGYRDLLDIETDELGRVFVADGANKSVEVRSPEGELLFEVKGTGEPGGDFAYPMAVAPLPTGGFLVAEFGLDRIMAFSRKGRFLGQFGRYGHEPGALHYPSDLAVHEGYLYLTETDSCLVKKFDISGWAPAALASGGSREEVERAWPPIEYVED